MLLLLCTAVGSFETQNGCRPWWCWLGSVSDICFVTLDNWNITSTVRAGWLSCSVFILIVPSFFPNYCVVFLVFLFLSFPPFVFLSFTATSLVCWLRRSMFLLFCPRAQLRLAWGCHCWMAKSPCCICNVYLCVVVRNHRRARLSLRGISMDACRDGCRWAERSVILNNLQGVLVMTLGRKNRFDVKTDGKAA